MNVPNEFGEIPASLYGVEHEFGFVPRFALHGEPVEAGKLVSAIAKRGGVTLDLDALNVFMRTELYLDGATPFREVKRFSPAPTIVEAEEMTREQAIEGYIELFRQAVARRVESGTVLALSGGRDSRHILLELHAQGHAPSRLVTVALDTTSDAEAARELARALRMPLEVMPATDTISAMRYTVCATELMSQLHTWFADVARTRDGSAWWDGIAGDVLSAGLFVEEDAVRLFKDGALDQLAEEIVPPGPMPYFRDRDLFPRARAVAAIQNELARHVNAANPVGSFYFWNRTRTNIAASAFDLLRPAGQRTIAPYLDRDLWRFLASVPLRHIVGQTLHNEAIARAYPAFAHIPFAQKRRVPRTQYRRRATRLLAHLASRRPSATNVAAAMRAARSLALPAYGADIDWIAGSWVYGDVVTRLLR